jgi:hypothetical protein
MQYITVGRGGNKHMEIYNFTFGVFMQAILAFMSIAMIIVTVFVIIFVIRQVIKDLKCGLKISTPRIIFFICFIVIPLIFSLIFGSCFIKYFSFDYNMNCGNSSFLSGDVTIVSCDKEYYRGSFSGYTVVIEVDGEKIYPSNTFSEDIVNVFKSDKLLLIQYGNIKNDGTYIHSIKILE